MKYYEVKCMLRPFSEAAADVLSAELAEIGFETFVPEEDGLTAYIQRTVWDEDAMRSLVHGFPLPGIYISYVCSEAPDEDWNQVWEEEGFQPIIIPFGDGKEGTVDGEGREVAVDEEGRGEALVVVHDAKHTDVPPARYDIVIRPRMAFGTGSHETTRLILRTLARLDIEGRSVIDAGTGTGILSIMALKRGAASVFAYDIDEWSVENARENLLMNGTGEATVACGDSSVLEGRPQADLLMANINRNILLADMPRFAAAVKAGGRMILSGFYLADVPVLVEAAARYGFFLKAKESEGEWAMLLLEAGDAAQG